MGWQFKWVSSYGTEFNYDFGVSFTPEQVAKGRINYNYGKWSLTGEEWPGVSFILQGRRGRCLSHLLDYGRGVEVMMEHTACSTSHRMAATKGDDTIYKMEWVRHHDRYGPEKKKKKKGGRS